MVPASDGTTTFHFVPFDQKGSSPALSWTGHVVTCESPAPGTLALARKTLSPSTTQEEHEANVARALDAISQGMLAKVVVSRGQQRTSSVTPEEAFANLCQMHPNALVYLMHHPEEGTWCGATPELLLRAQQHDVDTVSLAGTRRNPSVAWTDKERVEQQLVTDHILDVLAQKEATHVTLDGPKDRTYGELIHLETRISATCRGDLHDLAQALHPTPAVCGLPVKEATTFIRGQESHDRMYYAGFLGWSSPLGCAYYVNLRCATWGLEGVNLFAGGGIVEGSSAEAEWQETEAKLHSFAPAFLP